MIISKDDFAKRMNLMASPASSFKPFATYDPDGDCIEFLASPESFRAERVDDLVTVYYSQETGDVVGSLIKGVSKFCKSMLKKYPGFKIEIEDGGVVLQHIFLARLWSQAIEAEELTTLAYRKLIFVSADTRVDGNLCLA